MSTARVAFASLVVAAVAALAFACDDDTIVLARLATVADDGGAPPSSGTRCASTAECGQGAYCAKAQCADPAGTCTPLPTDCQPQYGPVCGCDGVMYYSDCLRRSHGVEATWPTDGTNNCPLDVASYCGPDTACDGGAMCAQRYRFPGGPGGPDCPIDVPGFCWMLPFSCSDTPQGPDRYGSCGVGAPQCIDLCHAIQAKVPFHPVRSTDCPPP